jgi:hypothetical protein
MSTSRIEVPLTLPPPHFDDDATIATARQVVPINGARKIQKRWRVLTLLPLLIASTLCGALGAIAVNYFERQRDTAASVTQQSSLPGVSTPAKTQPSPVVIAPESNLKTEAQGSVPPKEPEAIAANEPPTKNESADARPEDSQKSTPPAPVKRETPQDAAKLVRKRRVQPPDSEIPVRRNRRTEASRIEDLFTGPNP